MKMNKGRFIKKPANELFAVKHVGGKKYSEFGAEYVRKEKAVRRHRTGGRPHGRHRPMG